MNLSLGKSFIVACTLFTNVVAATPKSDWSRVQSLAPGTELIIRTRLGYPSRGNLQRTTPDMIAITIHDPGISVITREFPRVEVRSIKQPGSRIGGALLGAAIGAGAGAGIGAAVETQNKSNEDQGLLTAVLGFLGAVIGFGVGIRHEAGGKTIYSAP